MKNVLSSATLVLSFAATQIGSAAEIKVPADYPTIQAAVNAAQSDDIIRIAPGVYAGQVLISNKSLTLSGSPGTVLRAKSGMSQPYQDLGLIWVPLLGIRRSEVVLSNLSFEGEQLADSQPSVFAGVYYVGSSGRVEDCRITGFRGTNLATAYANGVRVVNPLNFATNTVDVQILRSVFADNFIAAAIVGDHVNPNGQFEPTQLRTRFTISDNIITGNGPHASAVQYGLHIYAGTSGEVSRNTISDYSYTGAEPNTYAFGILALDDFDFGSKPLAALKPIRFEGNILRNNQWHMLLLRGDGSTIVDNTFEGTAPGQRPTGLGISGENISVTRNRFSNMPAGLVLFGDDPDFGTYLGVTHNAQLNTNKFCGVTNQITVQSLVTRVEQGTLDCAAPPPLVISPAVLLSWPTYEVNWVVESAPEATGPWTSLTATPFQQGGRNNIAVTTEAGRRFYRLR